MMSASSSSAGSSNAAAVAASVAASAKEVAEAAATKTSSATKVLAAKAKAGWLQIITTIETNRKATFNRISQPASQPAK